MNILKNIIVSAPSSNLLTLPLPLTKVNASKIRDDFRPAVPSEIDYLGCQSVLACYGREPVQTSERLNLE